MNFTKNPLNNTQLMKLLFLKVFVLQWINTLVKITLKHMITLENNMVIFPFLKLNKSILTTRAMVFAPMVLIFGLAQPDVLKAINNILY